MPAITYTRKPRSPMTATGAQAYTQASVPPPPPGMQAQPTNSGPSQQMTNRGMTSPSGNGMNATPSGPAGPSPQITNRGMALPPQGSTSHQAPNAGQLFAGGMGAYHSAGQGSWQTTSRGPEAARIPPQILSNGPKSGIPVPGRPSGTARPGQLYDVTSRDPGSHTNRQGTLDRFAQNDGFLPGAQQSQTEQLYSSLRSDAARGSIQSGQFRNDKQDYLAPTSEAPSNQVGTGKSGLAPASEPVNQATGAVATGSSGLSNGSKEPYTVDNPPMGINMMTLPGGGAFQDPIGHTEDGRPIYRGVEDGHPQDFALNDDGTFVPITDKRGYNPTTGQQYVSTKDAPPPKNAQGGYDIGTETSNDLGQRSVFDGHNWVPIPDGKTGADVLAEAGIKTAGQQSQEEFMNALKGLGGQAPQLNQKLIDQQVATDQRRRAFETSRSIGAALEAANRAGTNPDAQSGMIAELSQRSGLEGADKAADIRLSAAKTNLQAQLEQYEQSARKALAMASYAQSKEERAAALAAAQMMESRATAAKKELMRYEQELTDPSVGEMILGGIGGLVGGVGGGLGGALGKSLFG